MIVFAGFVALSQSIKFGVFNDVHLNLTLHGDCKFPYCYNDGEYGFDSDSALVDTMMDDMHDQFDASTKIDVVVMSGDFVMHGLASTNPSVSNWDLMKETIQASVDKVKSRFPQAKLMPCIGNNDVVNHYQAPDITQKDQYYADLYNIWFANVPSNANYQNLAQIESTFKTGGYYRYDLTEKLTFITLNTIYYSIRNNNDLQTGNDQLTWLQTQLSTAATSEPNRKFIVQMHIFPGLFYFSGEEQFYRTNYTSALLAIINSHQNQIQFMLGAHIHWGDIRAPISHEFPDLKVVLLATPSISPIFNNNPGYSVLELSDSNNEVTDMKWRFLQLYSYIFMKYKSFSTIDTEELFDIDVNSVDSIRSYVNRQQTDSNFFGVVMTAKLGYNWIFQQMGGLLFPLGKMFFMKNIQQNVLCALKYFEIEDYHNCEYKA
eukprot:403345729